MRGTTTRRPELVEGEIPKEPIKTMGKILLEQFAKI
jgi:hypothetical protein